MFIEGLIEHTKTFKSIGKEHWSNFEVKRDQQCYLVTAFPQDEGNSIQLDELESFKTACSEQDRFSIRSVSVVFQDSKMCLRVLIFRKDPGPSSSTPEEDSINTKTEVLAGI